MLFCKRLPEEEKEQQQQQQQQTTTTNNNNNKMTSDMGSVPDPKTTAEIHCLNNYTSVTNPSECEE